MRRSPFFACLVLTCFLNQNLRADVAAEFEKYVNEVIPLTFFVASDDAYHREFAIFTASASLAQSHLAQATTEALSLTRFATELSDLGKTFCPLSQDGRLQVERTIEELYATGRLMAYARSIDWHVDQFLAIEKRFGEHCSDASYFERYQFSQLPFQFYRPDEIKFYDGVGTSYSSKGGNDNSGWFGVVLGVVTSVVHVAVNRNQRSAVIDAQVKLENERVSTDKYREYAKKHCRKIAQDHADQIAQYHKLADSLRTLIDEYPVASLEHRRNLLLECLGKYEEEFVQFLNDKAKAVARDRVRINKEKTRALKLSVELSERLYLSLARLESLECGKGLEPLRQIENDLALAGLYEIQNEATLNGKTGLDARLKKCQQEAL